MTTDYPGTIQVPHTLGLANPAGGPTPSQPSAGNPRSRWYVKHKPEVTPTEKARKSVGFYGVQIRRLLKLAAGEPLPLSDLNLDDLSVGHFNKSIKSKLDWLRLVRKGDRWTVNDIPRLRQFLGMEEL